MIGSARYLPFGSQRPATGTGTNPAGLPSDRLFTGQTRDLGNDGFYFFKSRYYDATIGKFQSPDSIVPSAGSPQALNRYAYALNNPLRLNDPSGHMYDDPSDGRINATSGGSASNSGPQDLSTAAGNAAAPAAGFAADSALPQQYRLVSPAYNPARPSDTAAMVMDMTAGRPGRGSWVLRFDFPDRRTPYPHINTNSALTGFADPIPHIETSESIVLAMGRGAGAIRMIDRVALPFALVSDGVQLTSSYAADGFVLGPQTRHTAGSVVGGWAGAYAGAWAGAQAGALIGGSVGAIALPGVGAVPGAALGAVVGGIGGGLAGSIGGSAAGGAIADGL